MEKEFYKKFSAVVAKAWRDEKFKKRLLENPNAVLNEAGILFPAKTHIKIKEGKSFGIEFVIPAKPEGKAQLGDEELQKLAAGGNCWPH